MFGSCDVLLVVLVLELRCFWLFVLCCVVVAGYVLVAFLVRLCFGLVKL